MTLQRKKELAIVAIVTIYTIVFFGIAASFFRGQQNWEVPFGSALGIAGIIWVALVALLSAFVVDRTPVFLAIAAVPALTLVVVGNFTLVAVIGALILFVLTWNAQRSIFYELASHIKIRLITVFSFGVRALLFGMLLSFMVFAIPLVRQSITAGRLAIPEDYLVALAQAASPVLERAIPGYSSKQTIDEMIAAQHANSILAKQEISRQFGVRVEGSETGPLITARVVNAYIKKYAGGEDFVAILVIMAVGLLLVRTVVTVITWPTIAIVAVLFWIAKITHLIHIAEQDKKVESIGL